VRKRKPPKPDADRRARFAEEYVVDFNATQAAVRSGYSKHTAKQQGSRLLSKADIQARVAELMAATSRRLGITVERTQQEIARIAYGDRRRLYNEDGSLKLPHELDDDAAALLSSLETEEVYAGKGEERVAVGLVRKVKTWDKGRALEQCMSILGMHKTATKTPGEDDVLHLSIRLSGK